MRHIVYGLTELTYFIISAGVLYTCAEVSLCDFYCRFVDLFNGPYYRTHKEKPRYSNKSYYNKSNKTHKKYYLDKLRVNVGKRNNISNGSGILPAGRWEHI